MRSHYKKLGPYIQEVVRKNVNLEVTKLLGVSVTKEFIPSIANTIGTDMTGYKVVSHNQFAYGPVTSRNSDKVSIALLKEEECIVSTSYTVFEILDHDVLMPEYLMMWFRRQEFDRYARFMSHGSVRELFGWDEMCNVELPIPAIEAQREIVKEYHIIVDRIKLSEVFKCKLEATAQTIYKRWFVDFEFPMCARYAAAISKPELEGKPYKSSDGEMVYSEVLEQEIPKGWEEKRLGELLGSNGYIRGPFGSALLKEDMKVKGVPVYEQQHAIEDHRKFRYYVEPEKAKALKRFSVKPDDLLISCSGTLAQITMIREQDAEGIINQALLILRPDKNMVSPLLLKSFLTSPKGYYSLVSRSGGSAQVNMAKREIVEEIPIVFPHSEIRNYVSDLLARIDKRIQETKKAIGLLVDFRTILLARLAKEV